nr:uncharacterized protein LOC109756971 [Aegilops tauschii subsp. strangulata]
MWTRLCDLFLDNQLQRRVFLQGEFFTMQQNDLLIDEYCTRLKVLADELRDVGMTIDDSVLLTNLLRGLHPDLGQSAANLSLVTPTYAKAVTYLRMEEKRLRHSARHATHAALHVGLAAGHGAPPTLPGSRAPAPAPPAAPAPSGGRKQKGREGRGRNSNMATRPPAPAVAAPPPPWLSGTIPGRVSCMPTLCPSPAHRLRVFLGHGRLLLRRC